MIPPSKWARPAAVLIVLAVSGFCLFHVVRQDSEPVPQASPPRRVDRRDPYTPPDETGFVGSHACAECHAEISTAYAAHPMAWSTRTLADDHWTDFDPCAEAAIPGEHRILAVDCDEGRIVHHERMYDESGELIYDLEFPLDYVVGSGRRARAYVQRRGDVMFMSPLNWYRRTNEWDLAPGYHADDIRRFDRRANEECLACHAGRIAVRERGANIYNDPVFLEKTIGCERCHGPGAEHVAWRETEPDVRAGNDPIVNPAGLDSERRDAVCYQCHLSAGARILRPGRSHLDFRPRMQLADIWAVLDPGADVTPEGRTRSVNHVQQMRDSRCFQASNGKLGCISCHDPHSVPSPETRDRFYRQRCLNCHTAESCSETVSVREARGDSCIACHMPALESSNMDHVAQTDHRVLRRPLANAESAATTGTAELTFFAGMETALPPEEQELAMALGSYSYRTRKGLSLPADLEQSLQRSQANFPKDVRVLNVLGELARRRNDLVAARRHYEQACSLDPHNEAALDGLLDAAYVMDDAAKAVECADRLLAIDPSSARVHALRGDALSRLGRTAEGIAAVRRAVELNPGLIPLHEWLAEQYARSGDAAARDEELALIERLRGATIPDAILTSEPRPPGSG